MAFIVKLNEISQGNNISSKESSATNHRASQNLEIRLRKT
jgi:hypothetical protein